jgi:hypothetical protein
MLMALSYAALKIIIETMFTAVLQGPPESVAGNFTKDAEQMVMKTTAVSLLPVLAAAGAREGLSFENVLEDIDVPGLDKASALFMLRHLVPPLLSRLEKLDKENGIVETLKRDPDDDFGRLMFRAVHAAFRGAYEVLDQKELAHNGVSDEQQKGVVAGIVSLSGAVIHALHHETGVDEDKLYELFDIPEKASAQMKLASQSTKTLMREVFGP